MGCTDERAPTHSEFRKSFFKGDSNQKKSGDEVYHTACSLIVALHNLYSKLHCQKYFDSILFSYKIGPFIFEAGVEEGAPATRSSENVILGSSLSGSASCYRVWGSGLSVQDLGFEMKGFRFRV